MKTSPLTRISNKFWAALKPPKKMTLSEWADENAFLSAESSAEAGRWHTIPYQKGIMDAITNPKIEEIWVMKSARVGFTKILNHAIGYHIHQDPCSMMLVQPTIEDAEGYSKEEIAPMIRDTPVLKTLVSDAKSRDGDNTILSKKFPGGVLGMVGANSPRGFRRVSRRVVLFDEVDGYPVSGAGDEGDQIKLGKKRTEYFWNRKIVGGSTPTVKDVSRIEALFLEGDQRRYFVPCPHCDHRQYLKWSNIKWPEDRPLEAFYVCEKNGCVIEHSHKRWMIHNGEWIATAPGDGKRVSFHIWTAYSLSPNASWGILAKEFMECRGDAQLLKTFINTALGETWEEEYSAKMGSDQLSNRAEFYPDGVAPAGVLLAVAGVDVQDNRFEITKWGFGKDEESWVLSHKVIFGDPSRAEIWKQLDEVLSEPIPHEVAHDIRIRAACIDSGGSFTHEVYQFCRERKTKNYLAIKGQSQRGKPVIAAPTKIDVNYKGQVMKSGGLVYPVGSDTGKDVIYARLKHNEPGPGYIHFHTQLPPDFFAQITSEKKITRYVKGFPVKEWTKKPGTRNEALDCAVYAYAAFQFILSQYNRSTFWAQMEKKLVLRQADISEEKEDSGQVKTKQKTIRSNRKNFVKSW
jgi:phage terminase large subunit GpA-like protein